MKKITSSDDASTVSLQKTFWRWFSFSVLALVVAAAVPALSADVFIDEGDGDFAPTPVSSPASSVPLTPATAATLPTGPAPASEEGSGAEIDSAIGQLEPAQSEPAFAPGDVPPSTADMANPMDAPSSTDTMVEPAPAKKVKTGKAAAGKHLKAVKKTASKAKSKKPVKAAAKSKKKKDTKAVKKSSKKKATVSVASKSSKKRGVASVTKYAGGQYATTSRACSMESAPGAGDAVGTTVVSRKLWVEESGNTSYWKVYGKSGAAAYVSRDCF